MKHVNKVLCSLLAIVLLFSLAVPALAANVQLSPQNLSVNGKSVNCEKYNIDGNNYFKLRDLAYLLNGTASQFGVGYDAATATVTITTDEAYTPDGTELIAGTDNSATAQVSAQTILIDGEAVDGLAVYNIGGNNYFMLRDLATELGFAVDYDEDTQTITVTAAPYDEAESYYGKGLLAYENGEYETAVEWYRKAAEMEYAPAQRELSYCYYAGNGVEQDYAEAAELCRKAAEQGDAVAQRLLGFFYLEGVGVEQDYAAGLEWTMKAAEQGDALAQANVAGFYEFGYGVEQDPERAEYWFGLAAGQGVTKAEWYYWTGEDACDLEKYDEAAEYYRKAAELGFAPAQIKLAWCYENGYGVEIDMEQAEYWYGLAEEQGVTED